MVQGRTAVASEGRLKIVAPDHGFEEMPTDLNSTYFMPESLMRRSAASEGRKRPRALVMPADVHRVLFKPFDLDEFRVAVTACADGQSN